MSSKLRIEMEELPVRPRGLSPAEISTVFGGCLNIYGLQPGRLVCTSDSDCCAPQKCQPSFLFNVVVFGQPLVKACY